MVCITVVLIGLGELVVCIICGFSVKMLSLSFISLSCGFFVRKNLPRHAQPS